MKKAFLLLIIAVCISFSSSAQNACRLRITLLTCAPGAELYSTFGHTAIRVQDSASGADEVYNYGTFEFAPDFYMKFVRGKLLYALSVESFPEFMYEYQLESRSVIEQELALNRSQQAQLYTALRTNAQPQNKSYHYDFLFDNCTTRARDMMALKAAATVQFRDILPASHPTFRDLIDIYLNKAHQDWSQLGIDLLLGAKMDRKASNTEAMFVPDNLLKGIDSATIGNSPLVKEKRVILDMPSLATKSLAITPVVAFGLLLAVFLLFCFLNKPWAVMVLSILDFLLFFITGLVGLLLLFMWFGTNHALCANNYNLLWALPTNTIAAFFVDKKTGRASGYFTLVFWLTLLLLVSWAFLPQRMNSGFLSLVAAILLRSFFLSKMKFNAVKRAGV